MNKNKGPTCPIDDPTCPSPRYIEWSAALRREHLTKVHGKDKVWLAEHNYLKTLTILVDVDAYKLIQQDYDERYKNYLNANMFIKPRWVVKSKSEIASDIIKEYYAKKKGTLTESEGE